MNRKIDISHRTIIFITVFLLSLWLIFLIRDLLLILFVAVILMSALSPWVKVLTRFKLPKVLSIAITYIIIVASIAGLIAAVVPPFLEETRRLFLTLPPYLEHVFKVIAIDRS